MSISEFNLSQGITPKCSHLPLAGTGHLCQFCEALQVVKPVPALMATPRSRREGGVEQDK